MTSNHDLTLSGDLDCDASMLSLSDLNWLAVEFNRLDNSYSQIVLFGNTERCADFKESSFNGNSHYYRILGIEDSTLDDFKEAWEHSLATDISLSVISAFR